MRYPAPMSPGERLLKELLKNGKLAVTDLIPLANEYASVRILKYQIGVYGKPIHRSWQRFLGLKRCKMLQEKDFDLSKSDVYTRHKEAFKALWPKSYDYISHNVKDNPSYSEQDQKRRRGLTPRPKFMDELEEILKEKGSYDHRKLVLEVPWCY